MGMRVREVSERGKVGLFMFYGQMLCASRQPWPGLALALATATMTTTRIKNITTRFRTHPIVASSAGPAFR